MSFVGDFEIVFRKAKEFHPDVNPTPEAHRKFQEITEAYQKITEERKQKEEDGQG